MPADHGPIAVNSEPRAASAPRTASDANHSPTKSADGHRQRPGELAGGAGAEAPIGAGEPQARLPVADRARVEPRRRHVRELAQEPREHAHVGVEPRVRVRVLRRDGGELLRGAGRVGPEGERRAVRLAQRDHPDGRAHQLEAVALELELRDDGRPQPADGRDDAVEDAADALAALEDDDAAAGPGERRRRRRGRCGRRRRRSRRSGHAAASARPQVLERRDPARRAHQAAAGMRAPIRTSTGRQPACGSGPSPAPAG